MYLFPISQEMKVKTGKECQGYINAQTPKEMVYIFYKRLRRLQLQPCISLNTCMHACTYVLTYICMCVGVNTYIQT